VRVGIVEHETKLFCFVVLLFCCFVVLLFCCCLNGTIQKGVTRENIENATSWLC